MTLFARERIKNAHNGRETRGVLAESTSLTVGASTRSVVYFFLSCVLLVFSPVLCGVLALIAASYRSSLAFILTPVRQAVSANPALVGSFYVYWIAFCIYILYSAHPHSLNVVKYQMFSIPWKYRRDHVSHMRLDRLRRAWPPSLTPGNTPKSKSPSNLIPIFIDIATAGTIALPVSPTTTVQDLRDTVCQRGFSLCHCQGPIYLMGLWRPLRASETMASLGIRGLCHFTMLPRLRGGAPGSMSVREDGTVVNEHGWEQGALNPDGSSKSAEDIDFGQDPGTPPPAASESTRPKRGEDKQARFKAALEIEAEDSDSGQQPRKKRKAVSRSRRSAKGKDKETLSEAEDSVYVRSGSDSDSDSDPDATITHEELAAGLPSKTIPSGTGRRPRDSGSKRNRKKQKPNQASDGPSNLANSPSIAPTTSANTAEDSGEKPGKRESPMYLFWEEIKKSDDNKKGDRFFRCRHGDSKKELKMTKAGKGSFTGLIGHMKTHAPDMYRFYEILNGKYKIVGLTEQEIAIAEGRKVFVDRKDFNHFLNSYTGATHQQTLRESLERAAEKSVGPWDQTKFERLLVEWLVACDQPFQEVERPELRRLLECVHHRASELDVPSASTVQRRVDAMGKELKKELSAFFASLQGMVSISLDAWTSSNGYAFLAIIAHYVTNDGKLEELLIDFQELIGEHSGDNMAHIVWATLEDYGLTGRVIAFMVDNATNNDTLVEAIERMCTAKKIEFSARNSRLRCMPHTVHLAVIQLLEVIGAIEKPKKNARASAYQEIVTVAPDSEDVDESEEAIGIGDDDDDFDAPMPLGIKASVRKLRKVIRAVRSSPQRRQHWYNIISPQNIIARVHMLILDVKTRWSSTHQMMNRALKYRAAITQFISDNRDLRGAELTMEDWDAIAMVSDWLLHFRAATSQMSTTSRPMLSFTHTIFRGLQKSLKEKLAALPADSPPELVEGLTKAHRKLSDYYYKYDQSPFYIWASLLDPRFNYKKLRKEYAHDPELSKYLEEQKKSLRTYFDKHYPAATMSKPSAATATAVDGAGSSRPKVINFAVFDQGSDNEDERDELDSYFDAPRIGLDADPVQWWYARKAEYPRLYQLARDIMSIPGSAVAVERVFSGGRDTISLRRASLKPETIRNLMLLKHHLRLKRKSLEDTLLAIQAQ